MACASDFDGPPPRNARCRVKDSTTGTRAHSTNRAHGQEVANRQSERRKGGRRDNHEPRVWMRIPSFQAASRAVIWKPRVKLPSRVTIGSEGSRVPKALRWPEKVADSSHEDALRRLLLEQKAGRFTSRYRLSACGRAITVVRASERLARPHTDIPGQDSFGPWREDSSQRGYVLPK